MNDSEKTSVPPRLPNTPETISGEVESLRIPVIEEQVLVGKRIVETGRLVVRKSIREEERIVTTPVAHEEFSVERIHINQYVDVAPAVRYEGDVTIVPVVKEVVVLEKRLVLVEEVHITKRQITTDDTQYVILRQEEVTVDRVATEANVRPETGSSL
jgi:uncharacterized protein (TIGR02271 family)